MPIGIYAYKSAKVRGSQSYILTSYDSDPTFTMIRLRQKNRIRRYL